jgi:hypothetical protein
MKTKKIMPIDDLDITGYFESSNSIDGGSQDSQDDFESNRHIETNHNYLNGGDDYFSSNIGNPII